MKQFREPFSWHFHTSFLRSSIWNASQVRSKAGLHARLDEVIRHLPVNRKITREANSELVKASLALSAAECSSIAEVAAMMHTQVEHFVLAAFAALLSRLTRQETVSVTRISSSPTVVRVHVNGGSSFRDVVKRIENEDAARPIVVTPYGLSYEYLKQNAFSRQKKHSGLSLIAREDDGQMQLELASSLGLWSKTTLEDWLRYLHSLLCGATEDVETAIKRLPLLDQRSTLDFYEGLNRTYAEYPRDTCAHELVARQVESRPDAVAVICGAQRYTYRELDERSSKLARHLLHLGAGPGRSVAVCMERSAEMPVALLAILKSGSCYVPLDPQNPLQRLHTILEECKPVAVISDSEIASTLQWSATPIVCMDEEWGVENDVPVATSPPGPHDLAYMIYTSGTTGKPKGVMIAHRSLVNVLWCMRGKPGVHERDRMLAVATISFDIATLDMFLPLIAGGTLVVADKHAALDPVLLADLLEEYDITVLQVTPVTWRLLVASGWQGKRDLKMISGGEALPRELANELVKRGGELWNCYGPTETTIYSGNLKITEETGIVPVGPPIANTCFYVMDEDGRLLPEGVPGELYIGGDGVSLGYLQRPQLTAERFVRDPFANDPGKLLFRTGDLVRIVNGNELEFFGRLDHQVKLRGYRIETGEIETVLRTHDLVENAVVILREDVPGEPRLVAYITTKNGLPSAKELREHAAKILPEYMLPEHIVALEAMPLTASGKIDRRSLPLPESIRTFHDAEQSNTLGVKPENKLEAKLLNIFREVLRDRSLGVTDSFFDFGGYSLLTMKLFLRINSALGVKLPISLLFDAPTVRKLAKVVADGDSPSIIVPIRPRGQAAPLFVVHSYLLYGALPDAIELGRPIYGIREVHRDEKMQTVRERASLYVQEIARMYPDGPLYLAGWCAAGSLTVELAQQLRQAGRVVGLVALFDAECPGYKVQSVDHRSAFALKLSSAWQFHKKRLQGISGRERFKYLATSLERLWDTWVETSTNRYHAGIQWLNKAVPFAVPKRFLHDPLSSITSLGTYAANRYPGEILLFRATDVPQVHGADETLGWKDMAVDGVQVIFVPGDHESMFRVPHLQKFGEKLQAAMREADAGFGGSAKISTLCRHRNAIS